MSRIENKERMKREIAKYIVVFPQSNHKNKCIYIYMGLAMINNIKRVLILLMEQSYKIVNSY